jgi:uncharacterized membrane protein YhdT
MRRGSVSGVTDEAAVGLGVALTCLWKNSLCGGHSARGRVCNFPLHFNPQKIYVPVLFVLIESGTFLLVWMERVP